MEYGFKTEPASSVGVSPVVPIHGGRNQGVGLLHASRSAAALPLHSADNFAKAKEAQFSAHAGGWLSRAQPFLRQGRGSRGLGITLSDRT